METKYVESFSEIKTAFVLATPDAPPSPPPPVVLLCHGFLSSRDSSTNRCLTGRFLTEGMAACRMDFFGHGESDGPFESLTLTHCIEQVTGLIAWLERRGYSKIGLIGSSFGGYVAAHIASRYPRLFVLGLKCPVSDYPAIWRNRMGEGGMSHWKGIGQISFASQTGQERLGYQFYDDMLAYDTYSAAGHIQAPTLVIHGDADEDVPVDQSRKFFSSMTVVKKEMEILSGADHDFSKPADFDKMIHLLSEWTIQQVRKTT